MGIPCTRPIMIVLAFAGLAWGQAKESWNGVKVVTRYARAIKDGDRIVDDGTQFRVYTVKEIAGDRLRISWREKDGWVEASDVVPLDKAVAFYTTEIEENPNNASAYNWRGIIWKEQGDLTRAIADYGEAIRIEPQSAFAYNNRGLIRLDQKEYDRAIADFDEAIRLDPRHALAHGNRGLARQGKKQFEEALADFNRAIQIDPSFALPYNERAWMWSTSPIAASRDGEKAVQSATNACELTGWKEATYIDTLAAAYAELGFFEQATRWQKKAISLAEPGTLARKEFSARLALYEKKLPFRQP